MLTRPIVLGSITLNKMNPPPSGPATVPQEIGPLTGTGLGRECDSSPQHSWHADVCELVVKVKKFVDVEGL